MSNENKARLAHELLDEVNAREDLTPRQVRVLRSFLPERPKQKTLAEITSDVYRAWYDTVGSDWDKESYGDLDTWLHELHTHLIEIEDTPAAAPALPAGMRLADHKDYGRCVVSPGLTGGGLAIILALNDTHESGAMWAYTRSDSLTFAEEPAKPAHPEFLETEADYQNAPEGTVVASSGRFPWVKGAASGWACSSSTNSDFAMSKIGRRNVLRWGWGE